MEQLGDILRTFINETSKYENRFGIIGDKEKMFVFKKLTLESLLNFRFRGTTMSYDELLIALESIIIDQVATVPSALMEIWNGDELSAKENAKET